jgi:anthranilate phosphoribosyltransferase
MPEKSLCQRFQDLCASESQDILAYEAFLKDTQNAPLATQSCFLDVMLRYALPCPSFPHAIDVCGTGGSGLHKRNISTAVAFVLASLGVSVSKHGNRSATSKSGSADVWDCLGLFFPQDAASLAASYEKYGLAFVFAPMVHPALKHLGQARKALGVPTVFNRLGPLSNPTRPGYQLLGVARADWLPETAALLQKRGTRRAWVVHGHDGSDDIALHHATDIIDISEMGILKRTLNPQNFPFTPADPSGLRGGSPEDNAQALLSVLRAEAMDQAYSQSVTVNAAAALMIVGRVSTLTEGCHLVWQALKEGKPYALYTAMRDQGMPREAGS